MSQADPQDSSIAQEALEGSEELVGPSLELESTGDGYVRAEALEDDAGIFSRSVYSLDYYDGLSDENIVLDSQRSAKVAEHYFGQHSRTDESLAEFLEGFDEVLPILDSNVVMELELYSYDGKQHVKYHEGEVARELIDYLDSESSWSSQTYFIEEQDKLVIQNSP